MISSEYDLRRRYRKHPLLSQFSSSLPGTIKELFSWMEFIVHNNPIAAAGIKKLSETPVTTFKYSSDGDDNETTNVNSYSWKSILEDDMDLKANLLKISYNTMLYGNSFISVYLPVVRFLKCSCGNEIQLKNAKKLKVFLKRGNRQGNYEEGVASKNKNSATIDVTDKYKKEDTKKTPVHFSCWCDKCKAITSHTARDVRIKSKDDINIIMWDPNSINISSNPISGQNEYFYSIQNDIHVAIKESDPFILSTIPIPMIEASLGKKIFKFGPNQILHTKRDVVNGISTAWGMPALTSAIPAFLTLMVLRKANEKIASDYMVPLRVLFPSQSSSPGEIYNYMGGSDFVSKINKMLDTWKLDPSGVQTTPFPVGTETILGDGKLLVLNQEIEQLESNIANSLGIPIEFIKGGLSYTAQGSSLRLLENQLETITSNLNGIINFIVDKVSSCLDKTPIKVRMVPFKIIDDLQEKAAIVQLAASGAGFVSDSTIQELFSLDSGVEQRKILADKKSAVKRELEVNQYQTDITTDIKERAKAKAQANTGSFSSLNQQALLQEAQSYVDSLMQMDPGMRRSQLDEISKTNYVLYGVVKTLLEMQQNKQDYATINQAKNQQQ